MPEHIPSLKAKAQWIPQALQIIRDKQGSYRAMEEAIASYWQKVSNRVRSPSKRNSLRAVFGPTLRHLQLVSGDGDELRLISKGKELLKAWEDEGEIGFKKALARHLVKLDKNHWIGLIPELQAKAKPTAISELLADLQEKYPESGINLDRLEKMLRNYYAYVGLVRIQGSFVEIRQRQIEALLKDIEFIPSEKEFFEALSNSYENLQKETPRNPYVPIPSLREKVCDMTGIWPDDFDKLLLEMKKETSKYIVHLTQPMLRKPGGIRFAGRYLYYLAIFRKGEKE